MSNMSHTEAVEQIADSLTGALVIGSMLSGSNPRDLFHNRVEEDPEGYRQIASEQYESWTGQTAPHDLPELLTKAVEARLSE